MTEHQPPALAIEATGLVKHFESKSGLPFRRSRRVVQAVDGVDLSIERGTTLGLVGESGSGKSTVARLLMLLTEPTAGSIRYDGREVVGLKGDALQAMRRRVQMVFQDPYSSFDPMATIRKSIAEPLLTHTDLDEAGRAARMDEVMDLVGLSNAYLDSMPAELSGGQLQRAAVARALAIEPQVLVLDEPVSALDVSNQAQVINLLQDLQEEIGVSLLFIAHDLAVVQHVSHRIAVMYLGRVVEEGPAEQVYLRPRHPYTAALLSAIPMPDPDVQRARQRIVLNGDIPSPINPPTGCRFRTRCAYAMDVCAAEQPEPFRTDDGTVVFCHLHRTGPELAGAPISALTPAPA